jgi:acid phosphatase (class A)
MLMSTSQRSALLRTMVSALLVSFSCRAYAVEREVPKISEIPYYLPADAISAFKVEPPAAIGSPIDQSDMKALKDAQAARTKEDCARALKGALPINPAYDEFFGSLGPFAKPLPDAAWRLAVGVWSDASLVSEAYKKRYKWPRAYTVDATIEPCVAKSSSPAFPSGHALVSRVFALVLSDIEPTRRAAYLERADEIAHDRLVAGMHRPSELTAAKKLADEVYKQMTRSKAFQDDLARARAVKLIVTRK